MSFTPSTETRRRPFAISLDPEKGRARQEFARECDINHIMERTRQQGVSVIADRLPQYADFQTFDFTDAMFMLDEAHALFMELPSQVRKHFNNDAGSFLDYMNNNPDGEFLKSIGLVSGSTPPGTPSPGTAPEPGTDPPPPEPKGEG